MMSITSKITLPPNNPVTYESKTAMILVIEDNPADVMLIRRLFTKRRIVNSLIVYDSGSAALDYLFSINLVSISTAMPTLILLDLKLPGMDGFQVLEHIRAHPQTRFIPVIVLTHSEDQEADIQARYHGANTFLRKPLDYKTFSNAMDELDMYWLIVSRGQTDA